MRLSELAQLIPELIEREGDLDVACAVGSKVTGIQEWELEPLCESFITVETSEAHGPFPGKRYFQIG